MKLGEAVKMMGPSAQADGAGGRLSDREPAGYSIDSRTIREGELFFAVRGENTDGHRFVADAIKRGAIAAVVARDFIASSSEAHSAIDARLIRVDDTLDALQSLASSLLRSWPGRLVAITGSMGKTTTKEMTAAALAQIGRVTKTAGNFNNAYGLPLSILKMETDGARASDFDFAVLEMGMNHKGEIADLTRIAPPDVGVVTIVAPVHLEFFLSVDEIAEAKAEMVAGVKPSGAAALNADDERVARMRQMRDDISFITFGIERKADVRAREIRPDGIIGTRFALETSRGSVEVRLPLAGRHNVYNALAAAAVADIFRAPLERVAKGLSEISAPKMRGEILRFEGDITLIDDSYNSNPRALAEMIETVCASRDCKRRIVVAGEMLELGETSAALHREAGRHIAGRRIDLLIGVRGLAREIVEGACEAGLNSEAAIFCETPQQAADVLAQKVRAGDLILVKGSRGVKTEIVVERLKQIGNLKVEAQE